MDIPFVKMQGAGNDYIYVITSDCPPGTEQIVRKMSDRHFGIGGDGVVFVLPPRQHDLADVRMRMFNQDGSEAEMCGNAVRCVGKLAFERGMAWTPHVRVETSGGIKDVNLRFSEGRPWGARVNMGRPVFASDRVPMALPENTDAFVNRPVDVDGKSVHVTAVSMGNPHAVLFVDNVDTADVHGVGRRLETHPLFPRKTNVEFVQVLDRDTIRLRVWERGAGETMACGTGSCAALAACVVNELTNSSISIHLPGGVLQAEWPDQSNSIFLTGPAETVFTGVWPEA